MMGSIQAQGRDSQRLRVVLRHVGIRPSLRDEMREIGTGGEALFFDAGDPESCDFAFLECRQLGHVWNRPTQRHC